MMQMTRKMSFEMYKQMKRQNPVTKKKLINSQVMTNRSKRPITLMNKMMTLTQKEEDGKVLNEDKGY